MASHPLWGLTPPDILLLGITSTLLEAVRALPNICGTIPFDHLRQLKMTAKERRRSLTTGAPRACSQPWRHMTHKHKHVQGMLSIIDACLIHVVVGAGEHGDEEVDEDHRNEKEVGYQHALHKHAAEPIVHHLHVGARVRTRRPVCVPKEGARV